MAQTLRNDILVCPDCSAGYPVTPVNGSNHLWVCQDQQCRLITCSVCGELTLMGDEGYSECRFCGGLTCNKCGREVFNEAFLKCPKCGEF